MGGGQKVYGGLGGGGVQKVYVEKVYVLFPSPYPKNLLRLFLGGNLHRLKSPENRKITLKMAIFPLFYSAFSEVISNNPKN